VKVSSWLVCVRWTYYTIMTLLKITSSRKCDQIYCKRFYFLAWEASSQRVEVPAVIGRQDFWQFYEVTFVQKKTHHVDPLLPKGHGNRTNFFSLLCIKLSGSNIRRGVVLAIMIGWQVSHHNKGRFPSHPLIHHILMEMYMPPCGI